MSEEGRAGRRITRRKFLSVAAAGAGISMLDSCASGLVHIRQPQVKGHGASKRGPIKLAVVPKAVGFSYWETVREGAQCATSKHKDVSMIWNGTNAETDIIGQVNLLTNYITKGIDGLVYAATDAKVLTQVTKLAHAHGVVVVNIDSGTDPQPKNVPLFATNNVAAARQVPKLLSEALRKRGKKGGTIAFIPFQPGTSTNDEREKGFKEALKQHPELKLVATQSSESNYVTGLQVTENILSAHPNLDGIFAANEPGVIGAAEAVRSAGKAGKIAIIGWDASPEELSAVKDGVVDALVVQNPFKMGYEGVDAAVKMIRTGAHVKSEATGATHVTRENLDTPRIQSIVNPSCKNPPLHVT